MNPIRTQRPVFGPMSSGRLLSCLLATLALAASLPAAAGDGSRSEQREQRQQARIGQGVASGELTAAAPHRPRAGRGGRRRTRRPARSGGAGADAGPQFATHRAPEAR